MLIQNYNIYIWFIHYKITNREKELNTVESSTCRPTAVVLYYNITDDFFFIHTYIKKNKLQTLFFRFIFFSIVNVRL